MIKKILEYTGQDGLLHIICSSLLVGLLNLFTTLTVAVIITAAVGLAKEFIWDKHLKKGTFETKDLICDLIGIFIGCI